MSLGECIDAILVKKESTHTIGVEFGSKIIEVGGRNTKLQIWYVDMYYHTYIFINVRIGTQQVKKDSGTYFIKHTLTKFS